MVLLSGSFSICSTMLNCQSYNCSRFKHLSSLTILKFLTNCLPVLVSAFWVYAIASRTFLHLAQWALKCSPYTLNGLLLVINFKYP